MYIRFRAIGETTYDVCVVGAGPAGIITTLHLSALRPDLKILLVEYGGRRQSDRNRLDDSIELIDTTNHDDPYKGTNKGLGGTSQTWGGRCVMYDSVDFLPREPFAEECTWPPGIEDALRPFVEPANACFECGPGAFDLHHQPGDGYRPIAAGFEEGPVTDSSLEKWSLPTRFGARYGDRLRDAKSIHVVSGCEARRLNGSGAKGGVRSVAVREIGSGLEITVEARVVVLACGGRETTRLLLRSPELFVRRGGVPSTLGRFYQGHVRGKIASVRFNGDPTLTDYGFQRLSGGEYVRRRFALREDVLLERKIQNIVFWLENPPIADAAHRNGTLSLMHLGHRTPVVRRWLAPGAIRDSVSGGEASSVRGHIGNVLRGLPWSLLRPSAILSQRLFRRRKLPGVFFYSSENRYPLFFHAEQRPVAENRLELGDDGESLAIHFRLGEDDVASVIRAHRVLDEWLRELGCGELEYWYSDAELPDVVRGSTIDGVHQIGTTRMSPVPEAGVVDADLRVWGSDNVYVCSSSVFPTSSQAHPTFLIGVFAIRLADHLSRVVVTPR